MAPTVFRGAVTVCVVMALMCSGFGTFVTDTGANTGGNDGKGHRWFDSKNPAPKADYDWIEINGTNNTGVGISVSYANVSLSFPVEFYGYEYTSINISTEGYLDFGLPNTDHTDYSNTPIPENTSYNPNNACYVFWDNLWGMNKTKVWFAELGQAPDRIAVVEWENITSYTSGGNGSNQTAYTFQCILYENDTTYKYQYKSMVGMYATGSSATIGIEDRYGQYGLQYSYCQSVITNQMAIVINQTNEQHDMAVESIKAPSKAKPGKLIGVRAGIANKGRQDQTGVNVTLRIDGAVVNWTGPTLSIDSFTHKNITFWWAPPGEANYTVSVRAENLTWENVTWNNERNTTVWSMNWTAGVLIDQGHGCDHYLSISSALNSMDQKGLWWETVNSGGNGSGTPITSSLLSGYDIFMALRPHYSGGWYSTSEILAIKDFVTNQSGALFVLGGDDYGSGPFNHNLLTGWAGIQWEYSGNNGITTDISAHDITDNVSQVWLPNQEVTPYRQGGLAQELIYDKGGGGGGNGSGNSSGEPALVISRSGGGKLAGFSDHLAWYPYYWNQSDNARLFDQIIEWLLEPPEDHDLAVLDVSAPEKPSVGQMVKVEADVGNIGLMDETGVNVSLRIDGTPVNWTGSVYNIASLTTIQVSFWWTPPSQGNFTVSVRVEPATWENATLNNEKDTNVDARYWKGWILIDQLHGCYHYSNIMNALDELSAMNYIWELHTTGQITSQVLEPYDLFISLHPDDYYYYHYTPAELTALRDFVTNQSKGLFVLGGEYWGGNGSSPSVTKLTGWVGIKWVGGGTSGVTSRVRPHEITSGISQVRLRSPDLALSCTGKGAAPLINDTSTYPNSKGQPMLAVSMSKMGKVAAFTDERSFDYYAWYQNDNADLFRQIIRWFLPDDIAPATPAGLAVQSLPAGNTLRVTWDPVGDVDRAGYSVMRAKGSPAGTYTEIYANLSSRHTYVDTGLIDGASYYYKVASFDEMPNLSPYTQPVSGTPADTLAPGTPQNVQVTNSGTGEGLRLTWDPVGAGDLEGYMLFRSEQKEEGYDLVTDTPYPAVVYEDTGLTEDTKYWYRVMAIDEVPNESDLSEPVPGTPHDTWVPFAPADLLVMDTGKGNSLELTWSPNMEADLAGYRVYRSEKDGGLYGLAGGTGALNASYVDTGLTDGKTYYYVITAIDDADPPNESPHSSQDEGIPTDVTAPVAPYDIWAEDTSTVSVKGKAVYSVTLSWVVPADDDLAGYMIYRGTGPAVLVDDKFFLANVYAGTSTLDDLTVEEDETYYYRVTAYDEVPNESGTVGEVSVKVRDIQAPPAPEDLKVTAPEEGGELVITWGEVDDDDVDAYQLYWSEGDDDDFGKLAELRSQTMLEYRHTGLDNGKTYTYMVRAVDDEPNESPFSDTASGTPRDRKAPETPAGFFVSPLPEGNALALTWYPSIEDDLGGYRLYRRDGPTGAMIPVASPGPDATGFLDEGLEDDREYRYAITAFDTAVPPNESPFSLEIQGIPHDSLAPGPPGNVTASLIDDSSVQLGWDAPGDADVAGYCVYLKSLGGWMKLGEVGAGTMTFVHRNLESGDHYFVVTTVDEVPNESEHSVEVHSEVTAGSGGGTGDREGDSEALAGGAGLILAAVIIALLLVVILLMVVQMRRKDRTIADLRAEAEPPGAGDGTSADSAEVIEWQEPSPGGAPPPSPAPGPAPPPVPAPTPVQSPAPAFMPSLMQPSPQSPAPSLMQPMTPDVDGPHPSEGQGRRGDGDVDYTDANLGEVNEFLAV